MPSIGLVFRMTTGVTLVAQQQAMAGTSRRDAFTFIKTVATIFEAVFTNSWFLLLAVPLIVAFLAIWLRWSARPEKRHWERSDFLIGFDLGIIAIVTMLSVTAEAANDVRSLNARLSEAAASANQALISELTGKVQSAVALAVAAPLFVIFYALLLIAISLLVSTKGWDKNDGKLSGGWIIGVDAVGFFMLVATLLMTGEVK